jgi:4-amino-4-deoxy-L-arabinose transferase-like glycosyltransferase
VAAFAIWHPSIAVARTCNGLAGAISVWLLYRLVRAIGGSTRLAATTAVLFGLNEFVVLVSRRAIIEPIELMFVLASAVAFAGGSLTWAAVAGLLFGLALLTKINAAFAAVVLVLWLVGPPLAHGRLPARRDVLRAAVFGVVTLAIAGSVYAALYRWHPDLFVRAFKFELDGVHFQGQSHPLVRVGRFGLDPQQAARTILALVREMPFFMVLMVIGVVQWVVRRPPTATLFGIWLVFGMAFFLCQMFQEIRYFYLVLPAVAYFAALGVGTGEGATGVLVAYAIFEVAYIGMNAVANRSQRLPTVVAWAAAHTRPDDRLLTAGYFATDVPNRAYAFYHLAADTTQLLDVIRRYRIRYVIYDTGEWPAAWQPALAAHFPEVERWSFGAVYAVPPDSAAATVTTRAPEATAHRTAVSK